MKYCHKCLTQWEEYRQPGPKQECSGCSCDLHVCLNCKMYNPALSNQCQANDVEVIINKEKFNFCEEFQFADKPLPAKNPGTAQSAREKWDKLFK